MRLSGPQESAAPADGVGWPEQLRFAPRGRLFFGDNLEVLRRHIPDESVDLVYLDPPFNSNRSYNVLFGHRNGRLPAAQVKAFDDTWRWDMAAAHTYEQVVRGGGRIADVLQAMRTILGTSDMLAYLTMMAPRLVELHRALKPTGSLYLHCDPTASHYLKLLLDGVFGPAQFANEIIWKRTGSKGLMTTRLATNHDVVLSYRKTDTATWNGDAMFVPYDEANLDPKTAAKYNQRDEAGRRYELKDLTNPNPDRPNLEYEFLGVTKVWRWTRDRMQRAYDEGLVVQTAPGRVPRVKRYLDEQRGRPIDDVWADIAPVNARAAERLGYPTQKPRALLERIIAASTNEGDVVLDPFCGCGTTVDAAQALGRQSVGIDVTAMGHRRDPHPARDPVPEPRLRRHRRARHDRRGRGPWPASTSTSSNAGPSPASGSRRRVKKGADRGIDGDIRGLRGDGTTWRAIVSVKGGGVNVTHLRDLRGTIEREHADQGILLTLKAPTSAMRREAADAGFTTTALPRLQVITVEDIFAGRRPQLPASAPEAVPAAAGRRLRAV
jgi:DNA modification methylase